MWKGNRAPYLQTIIFFVFQNLKFWIFRFFFRFRYYGTIWEENFQTTSPLKLHNRFISKKKTYSPKEDLYQSCSKTCEKLKFSDFCHFIFPFLAWDHVGVKVSSDISSESTDQIHSPKLMYSPREGPYQFESC